MRGGSSRAVVRHLRTLYHLGVVGSLSDQQLLERYLACRDETAEEAFAELVRRHGPMVLGVCRRILGDAHAAEDAFQATFLVLARKAASVVRREKLPSWLYVVAVRTAREARARAARRRAREEERVNTRIYVEPPDKEFANELRAILDEELARLPARQRDPVVLCELEGLSRSEAARRLGIPEGTLSSRLARAKARLRDRLVARGVSLPAATISAILIREARAVTVPLSLLESTVRAATQVVAGPTAAVAISASVASLSEGVIKTMFLAKLKGIALAVGAMTAIVSGAFVLAQSGGTAAGPERGNAPASVHIAASQESNSPAARPKDGTGKPQHVGSPSWTYHILVSRHGEPPRKVAVVEMTGDTPIRIDAPGALILIQPKRDGEPDRQTAAERRDRDTRVEVTHEKKGRFPAGAAAKRPMDVMYVNVYSTDEGVDQNFLYNFATSHILPEIKRTRGIGQANILGNRVFAMRVWLNPGRMRAYNMSSEDVVKALSEQSMIGSPGRLGQATGKTSQSKEYVLTYSFRATATGRYNKPEQYAKIVLKANPDGEILRLKDVGEVELGPQLFDIYSDINGHPAASLVLKQVPGSNAATVIEEVKKKLEQIKEESFPPGMNFEVTYDVSAFLEASEDQGMIYAVIQTPPGSTLEYTNAKSHEVQAIAKGIDGVTSVSSLAGYEVLTEGRGSNKGTCLIKLKNRSDRKLTSRQIIELLEEKCRTISDVKLEFLEPAAVPELRGHHP